MARRKRAAGASLSAEKAAQEIEDEYREILARKAVPPWEGLGVKPDTIGPTWSIGDDGQYALPAASLGWEYLRWTAGNLLLNGAGFRPSLEQLRFALHFYAIDPDNGHFEYRNAVLQRLKGWGKDPLLASIAFFEMLGPCRAYDLAAPASARGDCLRVIGQTNEAAWVQLAAVSVEQTKNTTQLFGQMLPKELASKHGVLVGVEKTRAIGTSKMIEAVTSNPATLEGGRPSFIALNEPHLWLSTNKGHLMSEVIDRNMTKVSDSRALAITNAYEPGQDSVAERRRDAHEKVVAGEAVDVGMLYDSLEAPPEAKFTAEWIPRWIEAVRGDSTWVSIERYTAACLDLNNSPSTSRRFYYNAIATTEDAWLDKIAVNAAKIRPNERPLADGDPLLVFFDGSKSFDSTGLVGCRIGDGAVFQLGLWQRPPGLARSELWNVDREEVDGRIADVMRRYRVAGLWADPSDARDETDERFWGPLVDEWHRRYGKHLQLWAGPKQGVGAHSVAWDMRSAKHQSLFVAATEQFAEELKTRKFFIGDDVALQRHLLNARKRFSKYGVGIGKESASSEKKIDLAVCAIGARMMRRAAVNERQGKQTGGRLV